MKHSIAALVLMLLAACGADGEPQKPQVNGTVTLSNAGASVGTGVSVGRGPFRLGLGVAL